MSFSARVRRSLTLEVVLGMVSLAAIVIAAVGVVQYRGTRAWLAKVQEEEARHVTMTLAAAVESMLEPDGVLSPTERTAVERLVTSAAPARDVVDVAMLDASGTLLAHAHSNVTLAPTVRTAVAEALADDHMVVVRDSLALVAPLRTAAGARPPSIGLYVRTAPSSVVAFVARMAWQIGAVAAGVAGLGTVAALALLSRVVLAPTGALAAQAERPAAGDLDARSGFGERPDGNELVRLGQALDRMAARITGDVRRLRASEASSREIIERAADGIFTSDEQGRVLDVNPAALMTDAADLVARGLGVPFCQVLELSPDTSTLRVRAAAGWPAALLGSATYPADRGSEAGFVLHADATVVADDLRTETRFAPSAQSVAAGAVSALGVVIGSGREPFGVLAAHATDRRTFTPGDVHFVETAANVLAQAIAHGRTDEALRASELRYRLAARATRDAIYDWDIAGDRLFWSEGMALLFGHVPGAIGSGIAWWEDYIHPDDRDAVLRSVEDTLRDRVHAWRAEYRFRCADGSYKAVHDRAYIEYAPHGRPLRAVGAMTDVSEKERTEADLRRQAGFVRLSREVAVAANGSVDVAETMRAILRLVCDHMQWPVGHALLLYRVDRLTPPPSVWQLTDHVRFGPFAASSEARVVERGVGMIGRVWARAEPAWIAVDDASRFARRGAALAAGLGGAVAFPVLVGTKVVGILEFFSEHATAPEDDVMEVIAGIATQLGRVIERARAAEALRDYTERLETLSRRLLQAQETERRHVACELHDEIGQALTALKLNLQKATNEVARGADRAATEAMIEQSIALVDQTLQQTRDLSLDLRPAVLDDLGLVPALRWCLSRQGERAGFVTEFHSNVDDVVPSEIATTCFRIAQEALTNVARHARATRVRMALTRLDQGIELVIRDYGRGFDREQATMRAERAKSLGLLSMGERAALIGGTLTIDSTVGHGTVVRAQLPLPTM